MPLSKKTKVTRGKLKYQYKGYARMHTAKELARQVKLEHKIFETYTTISKLTRNITNYSRAIHKSEQPKHKLPDLLTQIDPIFSELDKIVLQESDFRKTKNHPLQRLSSERIHDIIGPLIGLSTALHTLKVKNIHTKKSEKLRADIDNILKMMRSKKK